MNSTTLICAKFQNAYSPVSIDSLSRYSAAVRFDNAMAYARSIYAEAMENDDSDFTAFNAAFIAASHA